MADAVGLERKSRVVGYQLTKGDFSETSPNLPQRVAILSEANTANQGTLDLTPKKITSARQAGQLYGYGSPIYMICRILFPISGGGLGGIPVWAYPQAEPGGATAASIEIAPAGTATANATHTVKIAGRGAVDGSSYNININTGDTSAEISSKIEDAIASVLGSPVTATSTDYAAEVTTKWKGLTSNDLVVEVDDNGSDVGIDYTITSLTSGSGTPDIADALAQFGNDWNTIVVNGYGLETGTLTALEAFNGIPDPENPTGRYTGIIMKPFIAVAGSVSDDPSAITDSRLSEVTNAVAPAPNSNGFSFEAAANMVALFARKAQDTPQLDVGGSFYPDMPTPDSIGTMASYDSRDSIVKKGCSTVDRVSGKYQVQDFVTTYHPIGEEPPQYAYCRNLMVDMNIRFTYYVNEQAYVVDHFIANDNDIVTAQKVVKPKMWKQVWSKEADSLVARGLIVDAQFTKDSITVDLSSTNPDRLNTFFRYKRSGVARISSTIAEAWFNFGNV
jgi:phage tail sheath gpL-like